VEVDISSFLLIPVEPLEVDAKLKRAVFSKEENWSSMGEQRDR